MSSIENLMGSNPQFNSVLSRLENLENDAVSNLEATASTAVAAAETQLSNLTNDLRAIVPEGFSIPNVSLQSQLQSLSGLVDTTQSANLLASITTDFGDALSTSGFSLDTLVSDAASAFSLGDSLSGTIPNFELSPLGDIIQKASEIKVPTIDPVIEEASKFTENADFAAAKTAAANAVLSTSTTLPTVDAGVYKVSDKSKKITQSFDGLSITQEVTTPLDAFLGGISKRATISPSGFSNRPITITETFTDATNVVLAQTPVRIELVQGRTSSTENIRGIEVDTFKLNPQGIGRVGKLYRPDTYALSGKTVTIDQTVRQYDNSTWAIKVRYRYNDTYDPTYAI